MLASRQAHVLLKDSDAGRWRIVTDMSLLQHNVDLRDTLLVSDDASNCLDLLALFRETLL